MNREDRKYIVSKLGPHYGPKDIENLFNIPANSVKYYSQAYKIPSPAQTRKSRRLAFEEQFNKDYDREKETLLYEVLGEFDVI